jgi:RHS repeat-associated protein
VYLHGDHLGSIGAVAGSGGALLDMTRFLPFGGYRPGSAPSQSITDRDFTGQRENMELGLLYYNARFYAPGLGRFISTDTIIPNPADPQSYNRYSYVLNRALNFTDPTGHREEDCINNSCQVTPAPTPTTLVNFTAEGDEEWTIAEKEVIRQGAWDTAQALARAINTSRFQERRLWAATGDPYEYTPISAGEAFLAAYGGAVTFNKTGTACATGCWGERTGGVINVYTQADDGVNFDITTESDGIMVGQLWAVHELGHAFNAARVNATNGSVNPYDDLDVAFGQGGELSVYNLIRRNGMEPYPWQQHDNSDETNEVFADYFLNWTYNSTFA